MVQANGTVVCIHVAATKGFTLREAQAVRIEHTGIVGNREFFLVDIDQKLYSVPKDPAFLNYWTSFDAMTNSFAVGIGAEVICSRELPPHGARQSFAFDERRGEGWFVPGPWDHLLSDVAGRNLRLARCAVTGGGYDVYPVTLQTTTSLAALGDELDGSPLDPRRFRLNLTLGVDAAPFIEDGWAERELNVGESVLRVRSGIPRCLTVEHRPHDGDRSLKVQQRIRSVRGQTVGKWGPAVLFGVYADVIRPGTVKIGDNAAVGEL